MTISVNPLQLAFQLLGTFYISGDEDNTTFEEIANILFPNIERKDIDGNKYNYVMHLIAHIHSYSDYFVTWDEKDFINGTKTNKK